MGFVERWLKRYPLVICLVLACAFDGLMSLNGTVGPGAMPCGDGHDYEMRAFALYGFLHTGQWSAFWNLFSVPEMSTLAPPHYWLFFLLPMAWAGSTSYGIIMGLSTYLMLAVGIWGLCKVLDREEWCAALYLLCVSQNISLDFGLFYFCDIPFLAIACLAMAAQMRAWKANSFRFGLLAGAFAGVTFWTKPTNAVIFAFAFFGAELVWLVICLWRARHIDAGVKLGWTMLRPILGAGLSFLPITLTALYCGALHSIIYLLYANEISTLNMAHLTCTGLARWLYFPLCLSFFYNLILISLLAIGLIAATLLLRFKAGPDPIKPERPFPIHLLMPLLVLVVLQGEYTSFCMASKTMRSLLVVLPPLWLLVFWLAERVQVRVALLTLTALVYATCGVAQPFLNYFQTRDRVAENYQIEGDWYMRFPPANFFNVGAERDTQNLLRIVHQNIPDGGVILIGSDRLYLNTNSANSFEKRDLLLQGKTSNYDYRRFFEPDGRMLRRSFVGACGIMLYTAPELQYSKKVSDETWQILNYCANHGVDGNGVKLIHVYYHAKNRTAEIGYFAVFQDPLTETQADDLIFAAAPPGLVDNQKLFLQVFEKRLTLAEYWGVVLKWWNLKLDVGNHRTR